MSNIAFFNKLAADELRDTLFFATGEIPKHEKFNDHSRLISAAHYEVKIIHSRKIMVNDDLCKSVAEAKYAIQELIDVV